MQIGEERAFAGAAAPRGPPVSSPRRGNRFSPINLRLKIWDLIWRFLRVRRTCSTYGGKRAFFLCFSPSAAAKTKAAPRPAVMLILPSPGTACQGHPRLGPHVPVPTSLSPRTHVPTEHLTLLSRGLGGAHRKHEQQRVWKPAPSLAQGWSPGASTFLPDSETSGNLIEISKRALEVCNHPWRGPGRGEQRETPPGARPPW